MRYDQPLTPGGLFHIYNRGNNRDSIFTKHWHYARFFALMRHHLLPVADVFAFCFLPNHFHLLARIKPLDLLPERWAAQPSQALSNWFNAHARTFNWDQGRCGALFQRPFGRIPVLTHEYLLTLGVYIHINPQRHGIVTDFRDWPYMSYADLMGTGDTHLQRDEFLSWYGGRDGFAKAIRNWQARQNAFDLIEEITPNIALPPVDDAGAQG